MPSKGRLFAIFHKNWFPCDFLFGFHCFWSCFVSVKHGLHCEPNCFAIESLSGSDGVSRSNWASKAPAWLCVLLFLCASLPFCFDCFCLCLAGWLLGWLACWVVSWLLGWHAGWLAGLLPCLLASCLFVCWLLAWLPACADLPGCLASWLPAWQAALLIWCLASNFLNDSSPACLHVSEPVLGLCFCDFRFRI